MKYPRIWENKKSKDTLRVMPWWETVKDGEFEEADELGNMMAQCAGRPVKFGTIVQIGFLLENQYGMWFGVGPKAAKEFNDLGEAKKNFRPKVKRKTKKK